MTTKENIWGEIRNDFEDDNGIVHIDAWVTADDNEAGTVIAKIDLNTGKVEYLDDRAKTDNYAQEMITEIKEQLLLDNVLDRVKEDCAEGDLTALEELLTSIPKENLIAYLPEESWEKHK